VDVAQSVADKFEAAAGQPDARDPRISIRRDARAAPQSRNAAPERPRFAKDRPKPAPFKKRAP
jgi:hypothetical protein